MEAAVRKSEREENAEVARQAVAVLPSLEMLDKIMRYGNPTIEIFHHAKTAHSPALPVPLSAPRASRVTLLLASFVISNFALICHAFACDP